MDRSISITIYGVKMEAEIDTWKSHRGARDSLGVPLEPDEPAGFDVIALMVGDQDILDLVGDKAMSAIEEEINAELQWVEAEGRMDESYQHMKDMKDMKDMSI